MFSRDLAAILRTLDIARAPMPRAGDRRAARAPAANLLTSPPLSTRIADPAAYRALQIARRRALEALLLLPPAEAAPRALDLIGAICEEGAWAAEAELPFEDGARPAIDAPAADTAALLGWAAYILGDALDAVAPRARAHMLREVERRVLGPLLGHDDYTASTAALCAATTALLLLEADAGRLGASLRPLLRMLDATYACAEGQLAPLEDILRDATAIADFALLIRRLTAGAVDLTRDVPYAAWLDELLFSYLVDDRFCDFAGGGMRPALSGAALFRLGRLAGDGALRALGASLHRLRDIPSPTATGRLFDTAQREALDGELSPAPRLKSAALEDGRAMVARGAGYVLALTTGGHRANAGDVRVLLDGAAVLLSAPPPFPQMPKPAFPPAPDWDFSQPDVAIMGVDVSPAYAAELRVRAHQRTLMLSRSEYGAQLVDVFDFERPTDVRYAFRTPFQPEFFDGGAKLGPLALHWEGAPATDARRLPPDADAPDGPWEVCLSYPQTAPRAMFTFFLRHI